MADGPERAVPRPAPVQLGGTLVATGPEQRIGVGELVVVEPPSRDRDEQRRDRAAGDCPWSAFEPPFAGCGPGKHTAIELAQWQARPVKPRPGAIVRVLHRREVRYVVIGGIAAQIHDLPVPATVAIDLTPSRDRSNLERLAGAFDTGLRGVGATIRAGNPRRRTRARDHDRHVGGAQASLGSRHGPRTPRPPLRRQRTLTLRCPLSLRWSFDQFRVTAASPPW